MIHAPNTLTVVRTLPRVGDGRNHLNDVNRLYESSRFIAGSSDEREIRIAPGTHQKLVYTAIKLYEMFVDDGISSGLLLEPELSEFVEYSRINSGTYPGAVHTLLQKAQEAGWDESTQKLAVITSEPFMSMVQYGQSPDIAFHETEHGGAVSVNLETLGQ